MSRYDQPVSVGDVLEVEVDNMGSDGDGLAFVEGLAVVVPGTRPGEKVTVRIEDVTDNCAFAELWMR